MGIGDEIIASGHAKTIFKKTGKRVFILDVHGRPRWSGVWEGLDFIEHPGNASAEGNQVLNRIKNGPRCRPYIDYRKGFSRQMGMNYSGWRVRDNVGELRLSEAELTFGRNVRKELGDFVIIEPAIAGGSNPNKQWGWDKWQGLADILTRHHKTVIQVGPQGTRLLKNVQHVTTKDFRYGASVLLQAKYSILPDAGLAHAAGVLKLPAMVIWGGANDPAFLGYTHHEHIFFPAACRVWLPCEHCATIWKWLTPEYIFEQARGHL